MTDPRVWVRGARVGLGPYRRELAGEYWRWETDPGTILGYGTQFPQTLEARTAGLETQLANSAQPRFTVHDLDTGSAVGLTTLTVDAAVRTAQFVVVLAPEARGQGLGTEATRLTLDYAFHLTALRMVWLKVLEPHRAAVRTYEKAGFRHAGRLRQAGYWLGEPCDELLMDALPADLSGPSAFQPDR